MGNGWVLWGMCSSNVPAFVEAMKYGWVHSSHTVCPRAV